VTLGFLSSCCTFPLSFGFFKDADSNVAPQSYLGTAVGAGDKAVIGRMVWDDEFIAATLRASEGGVRHGACRPFWSALREATCLAKAVRVLARYCVLPMQPHPQE
jgi:hypothetical protein